MRNDLIIGLDIGSSHVRAVAGKLNGGKLDIIATGKSSTTGFLLHGDIVNIHKTSAAISDAISQIESVIASKNRDFYFSSNLSGSHINVQPFSISKLRKNPNEAVSEKEIFDLNEEAKKTIAEKNPCVLHRLPIGFTVGNLPETMEPVGQIGSKIQGDYMVVTASYDKFELFKKSLRAAESEHIKGGNLYFSPLATSSTVLSAEEKQEGVALVDIGSGTTEISVYVNKRLTHATVLNWGGDRITEDIKIGLDVSAEHAEALKVRFGSALHKEIDIHEIVMIPGIAGRKPIPVSVKNLAIIIEERAKELAAIVLAEISKVTNPDSLRGGIVLVGGGAQLPDISELFQRSTDIDTRVGIPNASSNQFAIAEEIKDPSYATAIGLVQVYFDQVADVEAEGELVEAMEASPEATRFDSPSTGATSKPPGIKNIFNRIVDTLMGGNEEVGEY
jgi:cell division protein FtsA